MIDTGGSVSLNTVAEWENIPEEIRIGNVDQILFAFIKSPIDNRQTKDMYGVPITYGCAEIINQINDCLTQVEKEYKRKEVFVGVDDRLFDKTTNQLPKTGLFKGFTGAFGQSNQTFWSVFDPAFRDVSYYNRLVNLFELLEKQVGTSKGILTQPESRGATATEIKASMYDTYALIEAIRDSLERGVHDFIYACDVLANFYNLTPMSEYDIRFDWSYSLIESSSETFAQYMQAESVGAVEPAEIRMYLMSDETLEDAQKRVDEIKEKKATLAKALLEKTMMEDSQGLNV
jgi:A118 family predicted phage portal protein